MNSTISPKADGIQRKQTEKELRDRLDIYLAKYRINWLSWSESEKPRRETIKIYFELFSLNHQIESEEATKPVELI